MTDEQRQRIHEITYSTQDHEELAERIVTLEDENERIRELFKSAYRCASSNISCYGCQLAFGGCTLKSAMHELGIEVS